MTLESSPDHFSVEIWWDRGDDDAPMLIKWLQSGLTARPLIELVWHCRIEEYSVS